MNAWDTVVVYGQGLASHIVSLANFLYSSYTTSGVRYRCTLRFSSLHSSFLSFIYCFVRLNVWACLGEVHIGKTQTAHSIFAEIRWGSSPTVKSREDSDTKPGSFSDSSLIPLWTPCFRLTRKSRKLNTLDARIYLVALLNAFTWGNRERIIEHHFWLLLIVGKLKNHEMKKDHLHFRRRFEWKQFILVYVQI